MNFTITINEMEIPKIFDKALRGLCSEKNLSQWFDSIEEAEEWADDITYDFACNLIEALGIQIVEN